MRTIDAAKQESLADRLRISLKEDDTDINRRKWAQHISNERIDLSCLLELLDADRFTILRFLWMVGGLVEIDPALVKPHVGYFFSKRKQITVPSYSASLAKMCFLAGIPEELEGEITDELFQWIVDPKINTSTKCFAVLALDKLCIKHPELKNELQLVIEDQLGKNGTSFDQRAGKILAKLKI